jgi:hypothetical protein
MADRPIYDRVVPPSGGSPDDPTAPLPRTQPASYMGLAIAVMLAGAALVILLVLWDANLAGLRAVFAR